jgi:hypothetical protein
LLLSGYCRDVILVFGHVPSQQLAEAGSVAGSEASQELDQADPCALRIPVCGSVHSHVFKILECERLGVKSHSRHSFKI